MAAGRRRKQLGENFGFVHGPVRAESGENRRQGRVGPASEYDGVRQFSIELLYSGVLLHRGKHHRGMVGRRRNDLDYSGGIQAASGDAGTEEQRAEQSQSPNAGQRSGQQPERQSSVSCGRIDEREYVHR
ncbi:hypothetical protein D3C81_1560500 [compost metagenome]